MRKLLTIVVFLLVLALAAAPGLMGLGINHVGNSALKNAQAHPGDIVVESGTIDGGYLSSAVKTTLRPADSEGLIQTDMTVRHFLPLGRLAGVNGQVSGAAGQYRVDGDIGFALDSVWTIAPSDGTGSGEAVLTLDKEIGDVSLQLGALSVQDVLQGATGEVTFQKAAADSWTAGSDLDMERVAVTGLAASNVELRTTASRAADNLSLELIGQTGTYSLHAISGPSVSGRLRMKQLHAPTIEQLVDAISQIRKNNSPNADQQLQQALFTALGPILIHQPVIETLEGDISSSLGNAEFALSARVIERPPSNFLSNLDALMGVVEFEIEAEISEELMQWWAARKVAEEYPFVDQPELQEQLRTEALFTLQNNGLIRPIVGGYEMNIDYQPGRVILNGQAMSLPDGFFSQM